MWFYILLVLVLAWWVYEHKFVKIIRFYRPNCRYCIESEDEWCKFKRWSYLTKYSCREVNLNNPSSCDVSLIRKYKVKSVPTIILVDCDGSSVKHEGNRDAVSLIRWARKNA
jgi:thioredoxin-related protein